MPGLDPGIYDLIVPPRNIFEVMPTCPFILRRSVRMEKKGTKAEAIRTLGREGFAVAEIARKVGVRYQHARNVLARSGLLRSASGKAQAAEKKRKTRTGTKKPALTAVKLLQSGFALLSRWHLDADRLFLEKPVPHEAGVYAFIKNGSALYVGVANMGLKRRLYFYARPGKTQRTSLRLNALLKKELRETSIIEIYAAMPGEMSWNGLPVSGAAGLELGLIQNFDLPWNMRSARQPSSTRDD